MINWIFEPDRIIHRYWSVACTECRRETYQYYQLRRRGEYGGLKLRYLCLTCAEPYLMEEIL